MKRWITVVAAASLLGACADTHQLIESNASTAIRLGPADTVFIAVPEDGVYGTATYRGSGKNAAQIIQSAFARHTRSVMVGQTAQRFAEALEATRKAGHKVLVYPTILQWEDRATEWSGIRDKVEVKIDVVDAVSGEAIRSGIVKGKSGWATLGGDHPQDLLPEPVEDFVSSIY